MPELKNDRKELSLILAELKKDYGSDPFDGNNQVDPEFLFYTVDRYLTMQKGIHKELDSAGIEK